MITDDERKLIAATDQMLQAGKSMAEIAKALKFKRTTTLYQSIYRLGYRIECDRKLVCIHGEGAAA